MVYISNYYLSFISVTTVIFKYIIAIEKSLKSKISYIVSKEYGVYTNVSDLTNTQNEDYLKNENYFGH